jgi:hypothetical protein
MLPQVGLNDNFFDLGGHSLLTVQAHRRLKEVLQRDLSITDIFRFPTIQSLSAYLGNEGEDDAAAQSGKARAQGRRAAMQRRRATAVRRRAGLIARRSSRAARRLPHGMAHRKAGHPGDMGHDTAKLLR